MNVAINTNLTDVIRGAISQLGGDARLVKATATKALQVPWFMGSSSGKSIPRSFSKPHVESFTSGEKILLVRKGDEFYYYNDDTDQWYMLNTKELLKHFTIEDSIKVDVSKPFQEPTKLTRDDLYKKAKDVAQEANKFGNEIGVHAYSDRDKIIINLIGVERRTTVKEAMAKFQKTINLRIKYILEKLKGTTAHAEVYYISDRDVREASNEYDDQEIEVVGSIQLTIANKWDVKEHL